MGLAVVHFEGEPSTKKREQKENTTKPAYLGHGLLVGKSVDFLVECAQTGDSRLDFAEPRSEVRERLVADAVPFLHGGLNANNEVSATPARSTSSITFSIPTQHSHGWFEVTTTLCR